MKRFLIALLMTAVVFSVVQARGKKKSGNVEGDTYTDATYPFKVTFNDLWKASTKKADDAVRLILTKKKYDIPPAYTRVPNYTTTPKITVMVDTTSMPLDMFVDSLLSDDYKSDEKKDILTEFPILYGDFQLRRRFKVPVGDGEGEGIQITAQLQYTISIQGAGSNSDRGEIVTDFQGGSVFFAKKDDNVYMMHFIGEWRYFDTLEKDFDEIVKGFQFTD